MKKSKNYKIGKNKFFNIIRGKKENDYFFIFPTIIKSDKTQLSWDSIITSWFLAWGKYYIQFNFNEIIKDTNVDVYKNTMQSLITCLRDVGLEITNGPQTLEFLNKNSYLTQIIKNANLNHPYIKKILFSYFNGQSFIKNTSLIN